jgi:RNA polymerase sigma-70 factor, ECF subfamily
VTPLDAFDLYHRAVYRFAYRLTASADAAEDVTQDCFLAFVRAPDRFDQARGGVKTYLFAIARNLILKRWRDNREHDAIDEANLAAPDPTPDWEISAAVASAVTALPPLQQEALVLFEYEGFTLEEIAEIAGTDLGTVKSRLHRARARLKRDLAPYRSIGNANGTI